MDTTLYNKVTLGVLASLALFMMSCGGKKHDAAYYMDMVDSIRKAEQVKEIQQKAGIYNDPVEAWFDTLGIHTLPIKSAGAEIWEIGHFSPVPMDINENFGYSASAKLKALGLPSAYRRRVVMVAEMVDSVTPRLDYGETYMEYYITSKYEIMLLLYYQSHHQDQKPELLNSRRFVINKDGQFEETIIEL